MQMLFPVYELMEKKTNFIHFQQGTREKIKFHNLSFRSKFVCWNF